MAQVWRADGHEWPPTDGRGTVILGRPLGPGDLAPFTVVATDGYRALAVKAGPVSGQPVLPGLRQSPHSVRLDPADHPAVRRASVATAWMSPDPRLDLVIDPAARTLTMHAGDAETGETRDTIVLREGSGPTCDCSVNATYLDAAFGAGALWLHYPHPNAVTYDGANCLIVRPADPNPDWRLVIMLMIRP